MAKLRKVDTFENMALFMPGKPGGLKISHEAQIMVYRTLHDELGHRAWSWMGFESAQGRGDVKLGSRTLAWHLWTELLNRLRADPVAAKRERGRVRLVTLRKAQGGLQGQQGGKGQQRGGRLGRSPAEKVDIQAEAMAIAGAALDRKQ